MGNVDWAKLGVVFRNITFLIGLGLVAYLGERGGDGGFIKDMWAQAKIASPFAAMLALFAWLAEREERREAQRQCNERTIDFIQSTNLQTNSIPPLMQQVVVVLDAVAKKTRGRR